MLFNSNNYLEAVGINSILGILVWFIIYITNEEFLIYNHNMFAGVWMAGRVIEGPKIIWLNDFYYHIK